MRQKPTDGILSFCFLITISYPSPYVVTTTPSLYHSITVLHLLHNMAYSASEIADIHFVYGFCNGIAAVAVVEYQRRFPSRRPPTARTFTNIHLRLREHGIQAAPNERSRLLSLEDEDEILRLIANNPRLSTRLIGRRLGISHWSVWQVLKNEGLHPYHFRKVQNLIQSDYAARVVFCAWINRKIRQEPDVLNRILWTDEAKFTRAGITNHRNEHLWMAENPHAIRPGQFQHEFSINVWAGLLNDQLIGPIVLPDHLNGERFLEFLQNDFLEEAPLVFRWRRQRRPFYLQMDGAPAHFSRNVRAHVDANYTPWIGRGGTIAWPPRSPDLSPLDYFFWGTMKQKVYREVPNTREELLQRIMATAEEIKNEREMVIRATQQVGLRAIACLQNNGGHFEQLL